MTEETKDSIIQNSLSRKIRRTLRTLFLLFFILLIGTVITVLFFPATLLRFALPSIESQTGIAVSFDKAYFSTGFTLEGFTAIRQNHLVSNFDLKADKMHIALITGDEPRISIEGLHGTYEKVGSNRPDEEKHEEETKTGNSFWERGNDLLFITESEIQFFDKTLEKPFQAAIQIDKLYVNDHVHQDTVSMFGQYSVTGALRINSNTFIDITTNEATIQPLPIELISPYVPILNDIFVTGSMTIHANDLSSKTQKKLLVTAFMLKNCRIKSADEILAPAIQTALKKLDQPSVPALHELRTKINNLHAFSESLRHELDKAAPIVEALKMLAPPDVRAKYEKFKSQYDRVKNAPEEWNAKLEALLRDIDKAKVGIVNDTFQHFIETGIPIEFYISEENGEWRCDWDAIIIRLIEQNFQTLIANEYQKRIQEMLDSVNRLLLP